MNKLIKNTLKTLTVVPIALPIVIASSCGDDQSEKTGEDLEIHQTMEEKTFVFPKGELIDAKTKQPSKSLLDAIAKFHGDVEKDLKKFKDKEGEIKQPITYDFSKRKLTVFPWEIFKLFEKERYIFKFPTKLKLNDNDLTTFNFIRLPMNIVKLDLSHNKLSGKVPLNELKYKNQGIYVNLNNNNYTTYDKGYLKSLKDYNHGITLVKDKESIMNRFKLWDLVDLIVDPNMRKFNESEHSISFPRLFADKKMEAPLSAVSIILAGNRKYTRVLLSDNKIKW